MTGSAVEVHDNIFGSLNELNSMYAALSIIIIISAVMFIELIFESINKFTGR